MTKTFRILGILGIGPDHFCGGERLTAKATMAAPHLINTQGRDIINSLPGDMSALASIGMGEGLPIWERMAVIIRIRRFNVRDLMAGFDRNGYGFIDLPPFQRALCNAFGNQWVELAMTTQEFREITEPYLTRRPQKDGEPGSFVQWSSF